jgi:protein-tyrosine-phosphatase
VAEFAGEVFDYVVTLCDVARTEPIDFVGQPRLVHWSLPDPLAAQGGSAAVAVAFDRVAAAIETRVEDFYVDLLSSTKAA